MASFFVKTKSDGKVQGPFTGAQLKNLAKHGKLKSQYLVSQDQRVWHEASAVKGLLLSLEPLEMSDKEMQTPNKAVFPPHGVIGSTHPIKPPVTNRPPSAPTVERPLTEFPEGLDGHEDVTFVERISEPGGAVPKGAIEALKQVFEEFAKPYGRSSTTFGCLMVLVIIAVIISCIYVSWLLGIIGGIAALAVLVYISERVEAPHKKRAKERISQLEKLHALSHQESFDLLFSSRSGDEAGDKNEWKAFVIEVWGEAAYASARKQEQIPKPTAGAEHPEAQVEAVFHESDLADLDKVASIVLDCAGTCSHSNISVGDKIPERKAKNARRSCGIPPDESLLVLIDCTSLGSAKNCLAFSPAAIYCHNDWSGKTPGTIKIPYSEIHSRLFSDGGFGEIDLDGGQFLNVSAAGSKKQILGLLRSIKARLTGIAEATGDSTNCPRCKSTLVDTTSEFKSSTTGHFVGQVLFGILGNVIAGAAFGRTIKHSECKSCGYKWVNKKGKH